MRRTAAVAGGVWLGGVALVVTYGAAASIEAAVYRRRRRRQCDAGHLVSQLSGTCYDCGRRPVAGDVVRYVVQAAPRL